MGYMRQELTLERAKQLAVTVCLGRDARESGVEVVARLDEALACRNLTPQRRALRALRVIIDSVRTVACELRNTRHLGIGIGDAICEDDGREVDLLDLRHGPQRDFLVVLVDDRSDVRGVRPAVALGSKMER